ncbi:hypothetical protein L218DRAFT_1079994 [Marasmius fiardii PR-910]|nr:hypothetical protein L218DRAFT_1079994 [Marasmius fiardii PR-910]
MPDSSSRPHHGTSVATRLEEHHLSRLTSARTRTLVMQRKRRILLASRTSDTPPEPGTTTLSYSVVAIEEISLSTEILDTKPNDQVDLGHESRMGHRPLEPERHNNVHVPEIDTTSGRGRWINTRHHRHYLRNGPVRRSRYDSTRESFTTPQHQLSGSPAPPGPVPVSTIQPRSTSQHQPVQTPPTCSGISFSCSAEDNHRRRPSLSSSFSLSPSSSQSPPP